MPPKPQRRALKPNAEVIGEDDPRVRPAWSKSCENCGQKPIVPMTGMCGPCTFGEAETAGGNW